MRPRWSAAPSTIGCCRRSPGGRSARSARRCARPSPTRSWCSSATDAGSDTRWCAKPCTTSCSPASASGCTKRPPPCWPHSPNWRAGPNTSDGRCSPTTGARPASNRTPSPPPCEPGSKRSRWERWPTPPTTSSAPSNCGPPSPTRRRSPASTSLSCSSMPPPPATASARRRERSRWPSRRWRSSAATPIPSDGPPPSNGSATTAGQPATRRGAEMPAGRRPRWSPTGHRAQVQAVALFALGRQLKVEGRYLEAEPALLRALTVAEMTGAHGVRATALGAMGVVLAGLGRVDDGIAAADEAVRIAEAHGTADDIMLVYVNVTDAYLFAGRYDDVVPAGGRRTRARPAVRDARLRRRAADRIRRQRAVHARAVGRRPGDDRRQPQRHDGVFGHRWRRSSPPASRCGGVGSTMPSTTLAARSPSPTRTAIRGVHLRRGGRSRPADRSPTPADTRPPPSRRSSRPTTSGRSPGCAQRRSASKRTGWKRHDWEAVEPRPTSKQARAVADELMSRNPPQDRAPRRPTVSPSCPRPQPG